MNLDMYTTEMSKSVWDKAFFMDKIPGVKCVIDFGCADGAMICLLGNLFPSVDFFGYDINEELLKRAKERISHTPGNVKTVYSDKDINALIYRINRNYTSDEICINFSSVLHEVFSCTSGGQEVIKNLIKSLKPKYITIRDMYYYTRYNDYDILDQTMKAHIITKCINISPGRYNQFITKHGNITTWKDMLHFLMKFQWRDNGYEQELEENYFSWNIDDVKRLVGEYSTLFEAHYILPYYVEKWKDLGFNPRPCTHAQFILRRDD